MIALIDGDSIAYIAGADKIVINEDGSKETPLKSEEEVRAQVDDLIKNILIATGATEYLLFLTSGKNYRYHIYHGYKANRIGIEPPRQMYFAKQYLKSLPGVFECTTIEADDAVSICANKFQGNSIICSPDKDILMLPGRHFNYRKMEFVDQSISDYLYAFWTSVIVGDTTDNIKGIPGCGKAYAEKAFASMAGTAYRDVVFQSYVNKLGEVEGIKEFYKNYMVLKILSTEQEGELYGFSIPEPHTISPDVLLF
jgi:5'-3' exonuclease